LAFFSERSLTTPAALPSAVTLTGRFVTLEKLDPHRDAGPLFRAVDGHAGLYDYLFDEPPSDKKALHESLALKAAKADPFFFAILENATMTPVGIASYLRIEPGHRVIEVGNILFTPQLQKTAHATEAMYLMAKHAFEDLGYRRYEWKCNALNAPSRRAALRLGFSFEGIFRQHMIIKGASRDTAWFAMLDEEWPRCKRAFDAWLDLSNFEADGMQKRSLAEIREQLS
jgi:RimJ/RimL family protein N-acetyltransferase